MGRLAKIHVHRGGCCIALLMMGLGYFLIPDGSEFLTAKSLSPISAKYPRPKALPPGAGSCLPPS